MCDQTSKNTTSLALNCSDIGVINVLAAEESYMIGDLASCGEDLVPGCSKEAANKDELIRQCMGATACQLNVPMSALPQCHHTSNYYEVQYQCIPSKYFCYWTCVFATKI